MKLKEFQAWQGPILEERLASCVAHRGQYEAQVWEAMSYSLLAGGKRIRPLMLLLVAGAVTGECTQLVFDRVYPFAEALEMIHTYSLIHDDLPAMDDDEYRRGRLTNHKVFGEAIAILAGDGLLNLAYETMIEALLADPAPGRLLAARTIAQAAGARGMVAGQTADMLAEQQKATPEHLDFIEVNKTGQLITAALLAGAQAAGAPEDAIQSMRLAGRAMGKAFQIQDDILDVAGNAAELGKQTGSDAENEKVTFVTVYGIQKAREMVEELSADAMETLKDFHNTSGKLLREWIQALIYRKK